MSDTGSDIGSIISAATGLTDFFSGTSSARSYKYQRKLQKHEQQFIERMSNTAHQREVADLQSAGLNPVLSAGGNGATTLSGGGGGTVDAGPSGVDVANMMANTAKTIAETKNIESDTKNKEQTLKLQPGLVKSMIELNESNSGKAKTEAEKNIAEKAKIMTEAKINELKQEMIGMDVKKRKQFFQDEIDNYKLQLKRQLIDLGMDSTPIGILLKAIDKSVSAISPLTNMTSTGGNTYNFTPVNYGN